MTGTTCHDGQAGDSNVGASRPEVPHEHPAAPLPAPRRVRMHHLRQWKQRGERGRCSPPTTSTPPPCSTRPASRCCWSATRRANNVYGNETSLPVTVDELLPLVRAVTRSVHRALVVADLPFGSYQRSPEQACDTAVRFMKEAAPTR